MDKSKSGVNVHKLAKKLKDQGGKLFKRLIGNIPESDLDEDAERFPAVIDSDVLRHLRSIAGISADIATASADSYAQPLHKERKGKALWKLGAIFDKASALRKQSKLIHWLEKRFEGETETTALCAIPKDLDVRLHRDLWSKGIPIILTSGTLSASGQSLSGGDFTRAKEQLGLNHMPDRRVSSVSMASPFDYRRNTLLYIPENMPFPNSQDKDYITAIADEVERLVLASNGHAAVLFTSYNAMGQVYSIIKKRGLEFPLFRLERGDIGAIDEFKKSGNGILFASGALWEGIDIPGDALSMLIIVKLPFPVPDPIGDYERSLCGDMETYKARAIIPDMLVKLKQGFGRLIRNETDTGLCAILDCRTGERGAYRGRVLAALPDCNVTSDVNDIGRFLRQRKSQGYFTVGGNS